MNKKDFKETLEIILIAGVTTFGVLSCREKMNHSLSYSQHTMLSRETSSDKRLAQWVYPCAGVLHSELVYLAKVSTIKYTAGNGYEEKP